MTQRRKLLFASGIAGAALTLGLVLPIHSANAPDPGPASGVNVNVVGAVPLVVSDSSSPARAPVSFQVVGSPLDSQFHVPDGKRLVIEYVSGKCTVNSAGQIGSTGFTTEINSVTAFHFFVTVPTAADSFYRQYAVAQHTRIYADPGTNVGLSGFSGTTLGNTSDLICTLFADGYLENM